MWCLVFRHENIINESITFLKYRVVYMWLASGHGRSRMFRVKRKPQLMLEHNGVDKEDLGKVELEFVGLEE